MTPKHDLYKILQVDPEAEDEIIAVAYKRLAAKYHPDVNPSPDAGHRMRDLNAAYEVLSDRQRREEYDSKRASAPARRRRAKSSPAPAQPAATLIIAPRSLSFGQIRKGACPTARLEIGVTEGRTLIGEVRATHPWIRLSVSRLFSDRTAVQVSVDTSELDEGRQYAGAVVVDSVVFGSRRVPVSVKVSGSVKPSLRVEPSLLDFGQLRFGQPPKVLELRLSNAGAGYLTGTLHPRQPWLSLSQGAFAGNDVPLQAMACAGGLTPGLTYEGEIDISSNAGQGLVFARLAVAREDGGTAAPPQPVTRDLIFLRERLGILESLAHPTEEQRQELSIIGYLLRTCRGGDVVDTLRKGISAAQGAAGAGWRDDRGVLLSKADAIAVMGGILDRLGKWQEAGS